VKTIRAKENRVVKRRRCIIHYCKVFLQDTGAGSKRHLVKRDRRHGCLFRRRFTGPQGIRPPGPPAALLHAGHLWVAAVHETQGVPGSWRDPGETGSGYLLRTIP